MTVLLLLSWKAVLNYEASRATIRIEPTSGNHLLEVELDASIKERAGDGASFEGAAAT